MARIWGETIDLTNSDDDDDKSTPASVCCLPPPLKRTPVPLPANVRHLYHGHPASAPLRPKQSPVPLPKNGRRLEQPAPIPNHRSTAPSNRALLYENPFASTHPQNAPSVLEYGVSTSSGQRNGSAFDYIPVSKSTGRGSSGESSIRQAEKRRKVAGPSPGKQMENASSAQHSPEIHTNGQYHNHKHVNHNDNMGVIRAGSKVPRPRPRPRPYENTTSGFIAETTSQTPQHFFGNKVPSLQTLNVALKSKGAKKSFAEDMAASEPRALHIDRMPSDEDDVESYKPRSRAASSAAVSLRKKSSSPDLEDATIEDLSQTLKSFNPRRSPKRRPKNSPTQLDVEMQHSTHSTLVSTERDSVISNSTSGGAGPAAHASLAPIRPVYKPGPNKPGKFTEEEQHLIIFLKEVKKRTWREIALEMPNRKMGAQTHYSQYLNKRDRAEDPPRLNLPSRYAAESLIDWTTVHREFPGSFQVHTSIQDGPVQRSTQQTTIHQLQDPSSRENSSVNELGQAKVRPRRNAPPVNYDTRPRRKRTLHAENDSVIGYSPIPSERNMSTSSRSSSALDEPFLEPGVVIPVDQPMDADFEQEDASLVVSFIKAGRLCGPKLPYLSFSQRLIMRDCPKDGEWEQVSGRDWQGLVLHVDFNLEEEEVVKRAILKILHPTRTELPSNSWRRLYKLAKDLPEKKVLKLAYEVRRKLPARDSESIAAFLEDLKTKKRHSNPHIVRIGAIRPARKFCSVTKASTSSLIRQRELGLQSRRGWKSSTRPLSYQMRNNVQDTLGPAISFRGASSDVHTVAWSPDGQTFIAGAVCVTDPDSMQYNRPNNLLYGDILNKTIRELGEHSISRPKTGAGPNSTQAMYASQDPDLYTTISSVAYSPLGEYMFSAGYDEYACIWRTPRDGSQPELVASLLHKAKVDILTVGCHGKVATAAKREDLNAIKVISINDDNSNLIVDRQSYTSSKALKQQAMKILPTALQFEPKYGRLLLAGFGANSKTDENHFDTNGDVCLWDVDTQQQLSVHGSGKNVFDVAFNPNQRYQSLFAVGCVAGTNVNRGTRSLLRLYDGWEGKYSLIMEIECAALDMNDVVWCPYDDNLIAAGCTSGCSYVWDLRQPDKHLYSLSHGKSLMPLDDFADREVTDTGVRFLSWGHNATRLYSGSSDGVVKVWDVVSSPQDVFTKDLVTVDSGIMSGAFSPDKDKLIVGEVNGSINILEVGRDDTSIKDTESFRYLPYQQQNDDSEFNMNDGITLNRDSGRAAASELLMTEQMISLPMRDLPIYQTIQGPNYAGPFDSSIDAPFLRQQALELQLGRATTPGDQCTIPSCMDNYSKITFEEIGDSGRSADRIPDQLRRQWKLAGSDCVVVPGKSKCTDCGRPARPVESTSNIGDTPRCERCSFACFRCGAINKVCPELKRLHCEACERIWEIGVLGYECVQETPYTSLQAGKPELAREDKMPLDEMNRTVGIWERSSGLDEDVSFGDGMNALTDYYLSLSL